MSLNTMTCILMKFHSCFLCVSTALIYGCPFCGVRFSSRRTLEAHLQYYCSKKPADFVSLADLQQRLQQQALELQTSHTAAIDQEYGK